jgi:hypothetical protein
MNFRYDRKPIDTLHALVLKVLERRMLGFYDSSSNRKIGQVIEDLSPEDREKLKQLKSEDCDKIRWMK